MQNSFPYIDIIIFGVIAIFLIFRLKNILGTKTGFEETNVNEKNRDKQFTNVVPLKSKKDDVVDAEYEEVNISEIDVIICGSLHALRAIHDNHEAQLKSKNLPMVVVSARIAVLACKFGYRRIICSRGTSIESIIECVTVFNIRQAR